MKFCSYCGKKLEEESKFCPYCGKSLIQNQPNPINTNQNAAKNNGYQHTTIGIPQTTSVGKILAVLSVVALLILFFFEWFQLPILSKLSFGYGITLNDILSFGGYDGPDLSGSYSVWGLSLILIRVIELISEIGMDDQVLIIVVFALSIIIFYLIAFFKLIRFIFIAIAKRSELQQDKFISVYKSAMAWTIVALVFIAFIIFIANTAFKEQTEIESTLIVLDKSFYISIGIAIVASILTNNLYKSKKVTIQPKNDSEKSKTEEDLPVDFCHYCGAEIKDNQNTCSECGKNLED